MDVFTRDGEVHNILDCKLHRTAQLYPHTRTELQKVGELVTLHCKYYHRSKYNGLWLTELPNTNTVSYCMQN